MLRNNRGQWALIEIVVVVALILVIGYFVYPRMISGRGNGAANLSNVTSKSDATAPMGRAYSVQCQNNLTQLRAGISMYQQSNQKFPDSLADLGLNSIVKCPNTGVPYTYDPTTGKVSCATPGHEKY